MSNHLRRFSGFMRNIDVKPDAQSWAGLIAFAFKNGKTIKQIARALSFKPKAVEEIIRQFVQPGGPK